MHPEERNAACTDHLLVRLERHLSDRTLELAGLRLIG
jgi:hypothetical protein